MLLRQPLDGAGRLRLVKTRDREQDTRARLLDAATKLFAERGFSKVPVRDICAAAGANVAAINYHFGGKNGIYESIVQTAIERMQGTTDTIVAAGRGKSPEQQLSAYISIFLQRVVQMRDSWIHQLLTRELADPTPALDMVLSQVLRPRMQYVADVIARLLGCPVEDPRVRNCVMSVQWQCLAAIDTRLPANLAPPMTPDTVEEVADHIARFSLGGIRAMAEGPAEAGRYEVRLKADTTAVRLKADTTRTVRRGRRARPPHQP
jgi:AcrR family transcriptional regulator